MGEHLIDLGDRILEWSRRLSALPAAEQYPGEAKTQLIVIGGVTPRQPGAQYPLRFGGTALFLELVGQSDRQGVAPGTSGEGKGGPQCRQRRPGLAPRVKGTVKLEVCRAVARVDRQALADHVHGLVDPVHPDQNTGERGGVNAVGVALLGFLQEGLRGAQITFGLGDLGAAGKGSRVAFRAPPSGFFAQLASAVLVILVALGQQRRQGYLGTRPVAVLFPRFLKLAAGLGQTPLLDENRRLAEQSRHAIDLVEQLRRLVEVLAVQGEHGRRQPLPAARGPLLVPALKHGRGLLPALHLPQRDNPPEESLLGASVKPGRLLEGFVRFARLALRQPQPAELDPQARALRELADLLIQISLQIRPLAKAAHRAAAPQQRALMVGLPLNDAVKLRDRFPVVVAGE